MTSFKQDEVTRGLVIKGLHFAVKTARLCVALQNKKTKQNKKVFKKGEERKEGNIQVSLALEKQSLRKRQANALPAAPVSTPSSHLLLWKR